MFSIRNQSFPFALSHLRFCCAILIFTSLTGFLQAQNNLSGVETLLGDESLTGAKVRLQSSPVSQNRTAGTLTLPFFDDFSRESNVPDPTLWNADTSLSNTVPWISISKGVHAPSKGVVTFDGAGTDNRFYLDELAYGEADVLESQPLDLSSLTTASNVWLSFFLEPGGLGDKPEASDSFLLQFDTTGSGAYKTVWAMPGDSLPLNEFTHVLVQLDQAVYFHSAFKFKFLSKGSLNGENDQWHLDYVYLNSSRSANDTSFNDVSVINFDRGILGGHTAIPSDHYTQPLMQGFKAELADRRNTAFSTEIRVRISDPVGGNTFTGDLGDTNSVTVPANSYLLDSLAPCSDQTFTADGVIRFTAIVDPAGSDTRNSNDTLNIDYKVDSVYALDDGIADTGYGLTVARSFCQEYRVNASDTLTAIWIHFVPAIYYNGQQSFSMDGKSFRLSVWNHLHPDSLIVEQLGGSNVVYSAEFNGYVRYPLLTPQIIDSTFWIGIRQVDHMPISIGFDKNFNNNSKIYVEDASGPFVNTTQQGTLMIRPEFGTAVIVSNDRPHPDATNAFTVFPNPVESGEYLLGSKDLRDVRSLRTTLCDLQGKQIEIQQREWPAFPLRYALPDGVAAGMYLLTVNGESADGAPFTETLRLIVR